MGIPVKHGSYNLLEEKWIPVLYGDGKTDRVGICQALTDACTIRQIAASNPMDRAALLRFLLAVLMWCKNDAKSSLLALGVKSAGIPENWLAKLKANKAAFNLLGDSKRFYQDESLKENESRPIGDLLVEFPGADSVNHLRHVVHDGSYGFCPACCAMGILRLSVWAPANKFYPASVNPGSAAYAFIEGKNLFQTLCVNLPEKNPEADQAPWLGNEQPNSPDVVARLAWRPRKLWLNIGGKNDHCANCGRFDELITSLRIEGGWSPPVTDGQQFGKNVLAEFQKISNVYKSKKTAERKLANKVVQVAQLIRKCRMSALDAAADPAAAAPNPEPDERKIARVFHQLFTAGNRQAINKLTTKATKQEKPHLSRGDMKVKKFWDEDPHLLKDAEPLGLRGLNADVGVQASRFWRDALRLRGKRLGKVFAIGPVVNKFTFQDATSVSVPNEGAIQRVERSARIREGLYELVRYTTPNRDRVHPEIHAATVLATPDVETRVQEALISNFDDKVVLCEIFKPVVEQIVASTAKGSPLRRRAAKEHANALLNKKIKELVEKPDHLSSAGTPAAGPGNPKRGLKKGGSTMIQTAEYIKRLSELQEGEHSRLRLLAGRSLDTTLQGFDLFTGLWWPLRAKSPATPRREPSWLVAKLFGAFRVPHIRQDSGGGSSLPKVLGRCEPHDEDGRKRFRNRFDALICSSLSSLEPHLRWALGEVARVVAGHVPHARDVKGIDWVQLLDDLSIWDRGEESRRGRDIRDIWAETYLEATY